MPVSLTANIKMYRMGELGDCFLIRFSNGQTRSHVLIDCGSFRNGGGSKARIKEVVNNIKVQLADDKLDVIVGTHQHNDHLSGFVHEKDSFEEMPVGQVWLSWLDDPDDQLALKIGEDYNNFLTNLRTISLKLNPDIGPGVAEIKEKVDSILGFYGVNKPANGKFPPELPAEAIKILRTLGSKKPKYLNPGQVLNLPGLATGIVKVYVLGPPKNETKLKDITPTSSETYDPELALANLQAEKFIHALNNLGSQKANWDEEAAYPFYEADSDSKNFDGVMNAYYSRKEKWRTIDNDWLKQAERLALWIDSYTNNSSLVLAFELVKANKVLLFAADAQTGNWSSWKEVKWKKMPAGFNWMNLIQKTVLYKVGHHGSHNSTLVEGLNNMIHEELVALIPVDKTDPNIKKEKNPWRMPAANLYKNLKQKTKNRVLRMDDGFADGCKPTKEPAKSSWKKLPFLPKINDMFIEYEVKG
jgi:hypothetical protein